MGFFDDVDIDKLNAKKKQEAEPKVELESEANDDASENLLDDLMPSEEYDSEEEHGEDEDFLDDLEDMFPEDPFSYEDSEDEKEDIEIEEEPVKEVKKEKKVDVAPPDKREPSHEHAPQKPLVKKPEAERPAAQEKRVFVSEPPKVQPKPPVLHSGKPSAQRNAILEGTSILGNIDSTSPIDVYGNVAGNVDSEEDVYIGKTASVSGSITAQKNVFVYGNVGGDITGSDVIIGACKIKGNITAANLILENESIVIGNVEAAGDVTIAGAVKGDINARGKVAVAETAIIQGNIKSAIISIVPGAAIDGTCTQEYAKVRPADFFANM